LIIDSAETRPPATASTVIGIDFGGTKTEVALADANGTVVRRLRLATLADRGPDQVLARAGAAARELAEHSLRAFGAPVASYAAVSPGVIQPDRILLTPNLPGWEGLALADRLRQELGVDRVPVANDVRAGALAELRRGALRGADPGVYLSLGTGIAAALTIGGRVLAGAHQAAGEIGYLDPGHGGGTFADGHAPLEELVGGKALGERASAELGEEVTATGLFARRDPAACRLAREALDALAVAGETILPALTARLARTVPFPPEVVAAHFTADASLHGAVALAVDSLEASAGAVG